MENPKKGVEGLLCKSSPFRSLKTSQRFKGMLPLGCLPLRGRERVTLLTAAEYKQMIRKICSVENLYPDKLYKPVKVSENDLA
jgi:hypothetical protein